MGSAMRSGSLSVAESTGRRTSMATILAARRAGRCGAHDHDGVVLEQHAVVAITRGKTQTSICAWRSSR